MGVLHVLSIGTSYVPPDPFWFSPEKPQICPSVRHQNRNLASAAVAVNPEVMVKGEYPITQARLDHSHQAGISQRHGKVPVFSRQTKDFTCLRFEPERQFEVPMDNPFPDLIKGCGMVPQEKGSFCQNQFICIEGNTLRLKGLTDPRMPRLPPIQERHDRTRVDEYPIPQSPKPSIYLGLVARSLLPLSTQPHPPFIRS